MIHFKALKYSLPIMTQSNLLVTDLIAPDRCQELIKQYPALNFTEFKLDASHSDIDRSLSFKFEASNDEISAETIDTLVLTPLWREFISMLTGSEYINNLSEAIEIDLTNKKWLIEFSRYRPGDFLGAHYDQQSRKLITQLFYFNQYWDVGWGGYLHILDPKNINTTLLTIPPMINYSVIISAKNDAWHSVGRVQSHAKQRRLAMALQFYDRMGA